MYCRIQHNKIRRTCKPTKNINDDSKFCFFDSKKSKCSVKKSTLSKINTPSKSDIKKIESLNDSKKSTIKNSKLIFSRFSKDVVRNKRILERLNNSSKVFHLKKNNLKNVKLFRGCDITIPLNMKSPFEFKESKLLGDGTFNSVYLAKDKHSKPYAIRILKQEIHEYEELRELLDEAELTLRLSALGVTPTINDIFFAKRHGGYVLVVISKIAERGSLDNFLRSDEFLTLKTREVNNMCIQTISLYSRMIDSEIVCIDLKPLNMVVLGKPGDKVVIKNIDFDTTFCSSKSSKIQFREIMEQVRDPFSDAFLSTDVTSSRVKKLLLNLSLLQVALFPSKNENQLTYTRGIIKDIQLADIPDMVTIANIEVGSGEWIFKEVFKHYYSFLNKKCDTTKLSNEVVIIGAITIGLFGNNFNSKNCI